MKPATRPAPTREAVRLLALDSADGPPVTAPLAALAELLTRGDVVIVNDAATFPSSLMWQTATGEPLEVRVAELVGNRARAFAFGAGDWRTDTERRPPPPELAVGDVLFDNGSRVARVTGAGGRLLELEFDLDDPLALLYRRGRPVQYSYIERPLALWSVQTSYASRPVAAEMPSAGRPLSWSVLLALRKRGVEIARLTHAAGLSTTGDRALDAELPLPERYEIPAETVAAIGRARGRGGRVVAVGTTVVRAIESAARASGGLEAGPGIATLRIGAGTELLVVDSILTGMHELASSHFELLTAFAPAARLELGWRAARETGFLAHELGDVALIAPGLTVATGRARCEVGGAARLGRVSRPAGEAVAHRAIAVSP